MASEKIQKKQGTMRPAKGKEEVRTKNENLPKEVSDMETIAKEDTSHLQKEYKILNEYMNTYMGEVEHLLQENKRLEKEAQQCQRETKAYLSYPTKHSEKYQDLIVTTNDQNHADLSQARLQKEKVISQYTEKEEKVRGLLMDVEKKYSLMSKEAEELQHFKNQLEHAKKIRELEKKLLVTKIQHSEEMQKIKQRFLQATADCEMAFHQKTQALTKRAEEAAIETLIEHLNQVKAENWHLHQKLLSLTQYSKILKETEVQLREQQQQLLWENQHAQNMACEQHLLRQHEACSGNDETHGSHSLPRCVH
ncbi:CC166 protein, partial [Rhinopomastus cyanomelas]|nr:CC166 protein [Rhinopomastus cyanomelas]